MTVTVKICGITNIQDAQVAIDAGADLLGFILYPKSPRYVAPDVIKEMIAEIKAQKTVGDPNAGHAGLRASFVGIPKFVGVFVNEPLADVQRIMAVAGLDFAQLHGDEGPEMLAALAGRAYKALRPATAEQALAEAERFAVRGDFVGPKLFIDAYDPREYGGTGKKADWTVAAKLARRYPGFMLAGGLTAENVRNAVVTVQPWAVDVASGVEASPGRKDHEQVRRFVASAKEATK